MDPASAEAWRALVRREMRRVRLGTSLLRGYAATNAAEFFAVLGQPETALPVLIKALGHESPDVRLRAINVLDRMGEAARPALQAMRQAAMKKAPFPAEYLNRLAGLPPDHPSHYFLAYGLDHEIDPACVVHRQLHHTPFYTVEALRHREEVRETQGERQTFHAGAWLGDGLHEGAVASAVAVSERLGGRRL